MVKPEPSPPLTVPLFQSACITRPAFRIFRLLLLLLRPEILPLPKAFFSPGFLLLLLRTIPKIQNPSCLCLL